MKMASFEKLKSDLNQTLVYWYNMWTFICSCSQRLCTKVKGHLRSSCKIGWKWPHWKSWKSDLNHYYVMRIFHPIHLCTVRKHQYFVFPIGVRYHCIWDDCHMYHHECLHILVYHYSAWILYIKTEFANCVPVWGFSKSRIRHEYLLFWFTKFIILWFRDIHHFINAFDKVF